MPAGPVADKTSAFWGITPKSSNHDFPVIPMHSALTAQLANRVDTHFNRFKSKRKKFNPSKTYNKIYRATDDAHFSLTKAHTVSATLLAEMKPDAVGCAEVGTEARLKKTSDAGKVEAACLERQERACLAFRMINASQLDNMAIDNVFQRLHDQITEYNKNSVMSEVIPSLAAADPFRRDLNEVLSILRYPDNAIDLLKEQTYDVRQINADLFNLLACDYIEAVSGRRKAWLDNSRIKLNVQRELAQLPVDIFSESSESFGDILGSKANGRLSQELEARMAAHEFQLSEVSLSAITNYSPGAKSFQGGNKSNKPTPKKKKNDSNNAQSFRGNTKGAMGRQEWWRWKEKRRFLRL